MGRYTTPKGIVSIHAPTRGATDGQGTVVRCYGVSIHAPTRGATRASRAASALLNVSIHAPTRGATAEYYAVVSAEAQFQSTHPRGVRPTTCNDTHAGMKRFQSTHPRGVRRDSRVILKDYEVSIHAPTRGATVKISLEIYNANIIRILSKSRIEWTYIFNH